DYRWQPNVFCNVPIDLVSARLSHLIERFRPQVVVTYDPDGTYQHPDHLHVAQSTVLAVETTNIPAKLYFKAHGTTYWNHLHKALAQIGIEYQKPDPDLMELIEQRITTTIEVGHVIEQKRSALHAHASQINSSRAGKLPPDLFKYAFGTEAYIRAYDTTESPSFENDLFTGFRAN
ncbi:MAG: PIG-L family deacetylase, partial [Candidatus Dormibacteraceae bacterium]